MVNGFVLSDKEQYCFGNITNHKLQHAVDIAKQAAQVGAPVLLTGEKGTGKKFFAKAIHELSHTHPGNFIIFDCSTASEELLKNIIDKNEGAACTLYLKDADAFNYCLQKNLLQFTAAQEPLKPGKNVVRIIASSEAGLNQMRQQGKLPDALFTLFSRFHISIPPLRERKDDIPRLVDCFLKVFTKKTGKHNLTVSHAAMKMLVNYKWRENIKELKNVIERVVVLEEKNIIDIHSLPFEINSRITNFFNLYDLDIIAKEDIQKVLKYTSGNKKEAARLLNIRLSMLRKKMDEYFIPV